MGGKECFRKEPGSFGSFSNILRIKVRRCLGSVKLWRTRPKELTFQKEVQEADLVSDLIAKHTREPTLNLTAVYTARGSVVEWPFSPMRLASGGS